MEHAKGTLIGQRLLRLVYAAWGPAGEPKAVVVLVHGYGEHTGRYAHVIRELVQRDYAVYTLDHRGHGESAGIRAYVERFDYFVEDVHLLVRKAKDVHPGLPSIMIGHSMGGLIATRYALRYQDELQGLVLSGAALRIGEGVAPLVRRVGALLALLAPWLPVVPAARGSESVLSRDPTVQELFDSDPLCYKGKVRARMGHELMRAAADARARLSQLTLPLLIMHGADDTLTDPRGSTLLAEQARSADKTLKLWPGCRHEIFNEPEKAEVLAFMLDWMDRRVKPNSLASTPLQVASSK